MRLPNQSREVSTLLAGAMLAALSVTHVPFARADTSSMRELQHQQLQDALELRVLQGPRSRAELAPADALRLEQLQLRQRMEQQQLEHQQLQRERVRGRAHATPSLEQRVYAHERQLQLQRFDLEQRALLRSTAPQPLQRRQPPGRLVP
jgi:hypothetical protein